MSTERQPRALAMRLRAEEPEDFEAIVGTGLCEMMPGMAQFWHRYFEAARDAGELRADLDITRAAEWIIRIVVSLVTVPGGVFGSDDSSAYARPWRGRRSRQGR